MKSGNMQRKFHQAGAVFVLALGVLYFPLPVQAASSAVAAITASPLLAHRATYRMTLDSVRNGSHVQAVEGEMVFEVQDACDGWNVEQRLNLDTSRDNNESIQVKSNYVTWESKTGTRFRFNYRHSVNNTMVEEYRGTAQLEGAGLKGVANYTVPAAREMILPAGSYFPASHTEALIAAAVAHKPIFSANVFDGTDAEGLSVINAVIGAERPIKVEAAKTGLGNTPAMVWPVRMAFFDFKEDEASPQSEMDTNILLNGVTEFMLMDYGEFRLRATLEKVELFSKPDC